MIDVFQACAQLQSLSMHCQTALADQDWSRAEQLFDTMAELAKSGQAAADARRLDAITQRAVLTVASGQVAL
jgi:hypothetical protein